LSPTKTSKKKKATKKSAKKSAKKVARKTPKKNTKKKTAKSHKKASSRSAPKQADLFSQNSGSGSKSTRGKAAKAKKKSAKASSRKSAQSDPHSSTKAEELATKQKNISVSEFFAKNRHLLGFDSPARALLTTVREAVDNSLDACEEAEYLPTIFIEVTAASENQHTICVRDNGPGIVPEQLPKIFGRLLYGSKFHARKQTRGQQGIGISAAGMYGSLTTGKPMIVTSRTSKRKPATEVTLAIDMAKNQPVVKKEREVDVDWAHGTEVHIELEGTYKKGKHSIDSFLEQVSLANPHVEIQYKSPVDKKTYHLGAGHQETTRATSGNTPTPPRRRTRDFVTDDEGYFFKNCQRFSLQRILPHDPQCGQKNRRAE